MEREEIKTILPHREPMLLVDEVNLNEDGSATGYYTVRGDEFFLQGHFPGNPIVPGVIQCEMMAQSACIMFAEKMREKNCIPVYTGLDKVKTDNVRDMEAMFAECSSLTDLDVSTFVTKNVKNMRDMFYNCSGT